jgi:hypothetical protein
MKTLKKQTKSIVLILTILILFQSCKSYYPNSVSLEKAVKDGKSASIIYNNDRVNTLDFDKIVKIDSVYYGIKKYRGELVKMPIQLENTEFIYKNPTAFQIILGLVLLGGIIWGIDKLDLDLEFLFEDE